MNPLEASASGKMDELMPAIERLQQKGISKQLTIGNKDSNLVVTYPPSRLASPMDAAEIYSDPKSLSGRNTLYVHIPYCDGICSYCGYARTAVEREDPRLDSYVDLIEQEIGLLRRAAQDILIPVETVYIGGGTPTVLSERQLDRLLGAVQNNFTLTPDMEYTLEGSPETVTREKVRVAVEHGVNRISIGAESFNDHILRDMNRRHSAHEIFRALDSARAEGITNLDVDLIRGSIGQGVQEMLNDIQGLEDAAVPSVTSYQFCLRPKTLDFKRFQGMSQDEKDRIYLHLLFLEGMKTQGRLQHPVDWFPTDEAHVYRHQVLKWKDQLTQLVVGRASYGYVGGVQFFNHEDTAVYSDSIRAGELPVAKGIRLTPEEKIRRASIFGLKTGIDRAEFREKYGRDPTQTAVAAALDSLEKAGGISVTEKEILLTEVGKLFADQIMQCLYSGGDDGSRTHDLGNANAAL